jgi:hypothetical protein
MYSVSWGVGKSTGEGALGWIASSGGDGVIRVWELKVSGIFCDFDVHFNFIFTLHRNLRNRLHDQSLHKL